MTTDARTQLQQRIDALLTDIEARKQAKIQQAEADAEEEIGAIIARLQEPVSLLPLIHTETGSSPAVFVQTEFPPVGEQGSSPAVPPLPVQAGEAGD